ncbi:hypothetical protein SMICM304S_02956 [Streptomyces microflavus]
MTFSKTAYRLNQTKASPISPVPIAQNFSPGPSGNSATMGRALEDMAVAP